MGDLSSIVNTATTVETEKPKVDTAAIREKRNNEAASNKGAFKRTVAQRKPRIEKPKSKSKLKSKHEEKKINEIKSALDEKKESSKGWKIANKKGEKKYAKKMAARMNPSKKNV